MIEVSLTNGEAQAVIVLIDYVLDLTCKTDDVVHGHLVALRTKMQQAVDVWTSTDTNRAAV